MLRLLAAPPAILVFYLLSPVLIPALALAHALLPLLGWRRQTRSRLGITLLILLGLPLLLIALLVPVHALALIVCRVAGWPHPLLGSDLNSGIAFLGLVLGLLGARALFTLRAERKLSVGQPVMVGALAPGFAELRGKAAACGQADRRRETSEARGTSGEEPIHAPPGALIHVVRRGAAEQYLFRRFWLEDPTGRVLVDPATTRLWQGTSPVFWEQSGKLHLAERSERASTGEERWTLMPGDPVYVLGAVEEDPWSDTAEGPDRLIVRPSPRARAAARFGDSLRRFEMGDGSGRAWLLSSPTRLFLAAARWFRGEGAKDAFLVSDQREPVVLKTYARGIRQALIFSLIWIAGSGLLLADAMRGAP